MSFADLGLHPNLLKGIEDLGFTEPLPVQSETIPHILSGRDVIACAKTGSGKTAAFMLPIMHRFLGEPRPRGPRALVLAPTRELALQSTEHLAALSKHVPLRGTAIFGGVPMNPQLKALRDGVDIISATPGRLLDHASRRTVNLSTVKVLVLDEADRITDMGFLPDTRRIIGLLPAREQTIIVSATIPDAVTRLLKQICKDPIMLQVGEKDRPPESIRHAVYPVSHEQKAELLLHVLRKMPEISSVIVFTRTKQRTDILADQLARKGLKIARLHGDRDQRDRARALEALKSGATQVLVATDVVARGIDIQDLSHVINYDPPDTPEAYIHRIGRTGRVDAEGDAITLMAPPEEAWITAIEQALDRKIARVRLPDFEYRASTSHSSYHPRPHYIAAKPPQGRRGRGGGGGRRVFRSFRRR